ncbi:MAG: hypothetical protein GY909_09855 [Oligoflexia bacterium]|nr:hypothetical protein [Oligoflexia bacterium]
MKKHLILALALLITACGKDATSKKTVSVTNEVNESSASPTNVSPSPAGPTGNSDPIDPNTDPSAGTGVTYYDDADPVDPATTYVDVCGVAFRELNQDQVLIVDDQDGMTKGLVAASYGGESYLKGFNFPTTAKNVCFKGLRNGNSVSFYELISTDNNALNPDHENVDGYNYYNCGLFQRVTDYSDNTYLEATINNYTYRLNVDETMIDVPSDMPHSVKADVTTDRLEGCLGANSGPYNNYNITFKKMIDVVSLDFGAME